MDAYLSRIAQLSPLTADRECTLAGLARDGDRAARDELITSMLGLVVARARHLGFGGAGLMDAVQSGTEGLIRAVDRFDPGRGTRLSSYAWWWIADAMKTADRELPTDNLVVAIDALESDPHRHLHALIDGLAEDEAQVLLLRYGCGSVTARSCTRAQTAVEMSLTVSQVRRLEDKAISHLRSRLAKVADRAPEVRNLDGAGPL